MYFEKDWFIYSAGVSMSDRIHQAPSRQNSTHFFFAIHPFLYVWNLEAWNHVDNFFHWSETGPQHMAVADCEEIV